MLRGRGALKRFKFQSLIRLVEYGPSPQGLGMDVYADRTWDDLGASPGGAGVSPHPSPLILTPPVPSVAHSKDSSSQTRGVIARGVWDQGAQSRGMLKAR